MGRATTIVCVCTLLVMLGVAPMLWGDSLVVVTNSAAQGANDSVAWSQLGADATTLPSAFVATSAQGMGITMGLTGGSSLTSVVCPATPCSWTSTGFAGGDTLIWTSDAGNAGNGPLTLTFAQGVSGAGAFIQADDPGQFTAQIQAYNGATLLGSFTVASDAQGDATYIGVTDQTGSNITSVTFSLTSCAGVCTDFAVDTVAIASGPSFPLAVSLAGTGSGTVSSSPAGINCPTVCSANFTSGQLVTLTAAANSGSTFAGWSGSCSGTGTCSVSMTSSQAATATFTAIAGTPVVTLSATGLSLGGQLLGTTSNSKSVTLTNTGTAGLLLSPIASSGNYIENDNCPLSPSTLAANSACTISVTFDPSVVGSVPGEITITDNASNTPQMINLTGTGLAPLSFSTTSLGFGTVTLGTTTTSKTVTLINNSSAPLSIAWAASADYAANPTGTIPCGASLPAKGKCTLAVTFTPSQNGSTIGALTVTYNSSFSPQEVVLSGTGSGATSPLSFSPPSLSFAGQLLGTTSLAKTVTITNNSAAPVTLSGSLPTSGNFSAQGSGTTQCLGVTLAAAGGKCTFTVTFSPSINLAIKGAVAIADNSAVSPQIYNLSGVGVLPLTFSVSSLSFAAQNVGTTSNPAKVVTVTNNLSTAVNISFAPSGDFSVTNSCGGTLNGLGHCSFAVSFTPSRTGAIQGVVTVTYSGSSFSPQELKLTGTGQ